MRRQIYLPELLSISIKNYTLYPNGLDYTFDFVKGVNLVLGGNGMGKTTFVNIVKFGLIGLYKKATDLTRTYKERAIIKRTLNPVDFFSARKDDTIQVDGEAIVNLSFKINNTIVGVERSLETGQLLSLVVEGNPLIGHVVSEDRYERMDNNQQKLCLLYKYEQFIKEKSNLTFDDLIFFVNEILFFGEDHKTVLWNDSNDGKTDVQNELFNKYFNEPELDLKRQEALRQAKYYDSLSRHKSEDMRVITNLMKKMQFKEQTGTHSDTQVPSALDVVELNNQLENVQGTLARIQSQRESYSKDIEIIQGEINRASLDASRLDGEKTKIEKEMNVALWEKLHPQYDVFVKNIQYNHICPMCNKEDDALAERISTTKSNICFVCGNEIRPNSKPELTEKYKSISSAHKNLYQSIISRQRKIRAIEDELKALDSEFKEKDLQRRSILQMLREQEYQRSKATNYDKLQTLDDEYHTYAREKTEYQKKSAECAREANMLTQQIEQEILNNVSRFSAIFAMYAESFLGVQCSLEYQSYEGMTKRFYPVIDGKIRRQEESLSESQRFFIDHSFRMSILTFFYNTPSFYIVETPDSSLDLSYEKNAADVFVRFLTKPNSVIVTSNLNNSSFINHLLANEKLCFSLVGLPDIAKRTAVQGASEQLLSLYNRIKIKIEYE